MFLRKFAKIAAIIITNIFTLTLFLHLVICLFVLTGFYKEYVCFALTGIIYSLVIIVIEKATIKKMKITSKMYFISTTLIPMLFFNMLFLISTNNTKTTSILEKSDDLLIIFMSIVTIIIFSIVSIIKITNLLIKKIKKC